MNRGLVATRIGYFGKVPGRADFVKASDNPALLDVLDAWLAQAMELLGADPHWKRSYDTLAPLHFAFVGPRRGRAIGGHIRASCDQAQRRFPFLMMSTMDVAEPARFVPNSPLVLAPLWHRLDSLSATALAAPDPGAVLQQAAGSVIDIDLGAASHDATFDAFLSTHSVGALDALLAQAGFTGALRQVMLALGLLLQPVLASSSNRLEKSLRLPLPAAPHDQNLVAAFWMHLIAPFLARADFELALFVTRHDGRPVLVLGFSGASAQTLHALLDPRTATEHHISFDDLAWVEEQLADDYAVAKLSAYLAQPALTLKSAHDALRAAFLGA